MSSEEETASRRFLCFWDRICSRVSESKQNKNREDAIMVKCQIARAIKPQIRDRKHNFCESVDIGELYLKSAIQHLFCGGLPFGT